MIMAHKDDLNEMNLNEMLADAACLYPGKPAVIEGHNQTSYAALVGMISGLERLLRQAKIQSGARVGLHLPGNTHYIALTYALWRIRAVVVPIPMECSREEVAEIIGKMELAAVVSATADATAELLVQGIYLHRLPVVTPADNHGLNLAFIRFTSGTTSARKGVALSHETIRDRVLSANRCFKIGPDDVVMWNLSMAHHFLITIVLYLSRGTTIVLVQHATPRSFLSELNHWQATVLYSSPRFFGLLARDASGIQVPSVRLAISTTSSLNESVAADFHQRFNLPLIQALGVIELGLVAINLEAPLEQWNSVGKAAGNFRVRVASPDSNGVGELAVSGPGILDAYVAPWIARNQILRDGWFHTGDVAKMSENGFIYLLSRTTNVINRAGQKVFPEEVESIINRHPDVRESRVFGRRDSRLGEVVEADLVLENQESNLAAIREYCRAQLAAHKVPVQMRVVNELPRTAVTGKIQRRPSV
jgi:long-chain acyl-CoA synthetase